MDVPLYFGQRMSAAVRDRGVMLERVVRANPGLEAAIEAGVEVELGISVWGAFRPDPVMRELGGACLGVADQSRSWLIGYDRLIVAAGARDLGLAFRGWEKAGTMGAAGALALLARYQAFAARRMVVLGSGPLGLAVAALARTRGIEVAAIVEVGPALRCDAADAGPPRAGRHALLSAPRGRRGARRAATSSRASASPRSTAISGPSPGARSTSRATPSCLAIGLVPQVELLQLLGCRLALPLRARRLRPRDRRRRSARACPEVFAAGDVAGVDERRVAGARARARRGAPRGRRRRRVARRDRRRIDGAGAPARDPGAGRARAGPARPRLLAAVAPGHAGAAAGGDILACQCEEVTRGELVGVQPPRYLGARSPTDARPEPRHAEQDGPLNPDQVKRLTRAGMGPCQGRRCREQVALLLARRATCPIDTIPLASYRPPVRPLPLSVLWPHDEPASMRENWVSWFGIPTQFAPHWAGDPDMPVMLDVPGAAPVESRTR